MNENQPISEQDADSLRSALDQSEEELYVQLGAANYLGAAPPSRSDLLDRGKQLLTKRKKELQKAICHNAAIQGVANKNEPYDIVVAVFAVLMATPELRISAPSSAAILAALITKKSINWLCKSVGHTQKKGGS